MERKRKEPNRDHTVMHGKREDDGFVEDPFVKHASRRLTTKEFSALLESKPSYESVESSIVKDVFGEGILLEAAPGAKLDATSSPFMSHQIKQAWLRRYKAYGVELGHDGFVSKEQRFLYSLFSSYRNVFYPMRKLPSKESGYDFDAVLDAIVAHSVDHVLRSKQRLQNQITKRQRPKKQKSVKVEKPVNRKLIEEKEEEEEDRLLGFTQPKVLFLVPMRNKAYNVVKRILELGPHPTQTGLDIVLNKLKASYGPDEELEAAFKKQKKVEQKKPADHESLFYGHVADTVKIGVKVHLNGEFSFFRPLEESDIIIASPISLALSLEKKEPKIVDCLSSIEVLVVDWMDVILMQNWQHMDTVVKHLNRLPKGSLGNVHLTQVQRYFLEDQGKCYRQTLLFSSFLSGEMNHLMNGELCSNHAGHFRFRKHYLNLLPQMQKTVRFRFEKFLCSRISDIANSRFDYFTAKVMGKIQDSMEFGILLFIPHYFDFVRLCDWLKQENLDYEGLSEYTGMRKMTKIRNKFRKGNVRVIVITERAYFYHRSTLKGIKSIIFYGLPEHNQFFLELIHLAETHEMMVTSLYSRFCIYQLERIVGTVKALQLVSSEDPISVLM